MIFRKSYLNELRTDIIGLIEFMNGADEHTILTSPSLLESRPSSESVDRTLAALDRRLYRFNASCNAQIEHSHNCMEHLKQRESNIVVLLHKTAQRMLGQLKSVRYIANPELNRIRKVQLSHVQEFDQLANNAVHDVIGYNMSLFLTSQRVSVSVTTLVQYLRDVITSSHVDSDRVGLFIRTVWRLHGQLDSLLDTIDRLLELTAQVIAKMKELMQAEQADGDGFSDEISRILHHGIEDDMQFERHWIDNFRSYVD